jgi:hypothetical protein
MQMREADMRADLQTASGAHQMKLAEIQADTQAEIAKIQAKGETDIQVELVQSRANAEQQAEGVEAEMNKDIVAHRLDMEKLRATTEAKITEIAVQSRAKTTELQESERIRADQEPSSDT